GLRGRVRPGGRADFADHADHGVPAWRAGRRPDGDVPGRPVHDPLGPGRQRGAVGALRALARGRPAGRLADHGAGAGRRPDVPGRRRGGGGARRPPRVSAAERREGAGLMPGSTTMVGYDEAVSRYDPLIGLETHVELGTRTKLFCGCPATFGGEPNTQVCPVCLGLPGSLPVPSRAAIEYTIRIGLALNCSIAEWCRFARKNYFYPDMQRNSQISQYDEPLCTDGWLEVTLDEAEAAPYGNSGGPRTFRVGIERVHLEEDTGKSQHMGGATGRIHG